MNHAGCLQFADEGDAAGGLRHNAASHPRGALVHGRPILPAGLIHLFPIKIALVEGITAILDQGVCPLADECKKIQPVPWRQSFPALLPVEERKNPPRIRIIAQHVKRRFNYSDASPKAGERREVDFAPFYRFHPYFMAHI